MLLNPSFTDRHFRKGNDIFSEFAKYVFESSDT
jgi:hypothetical protein